MQEFLWLSFAHFLFTQKPSKMSFYDGLIFDFANTTTNTQ